MTTQAWMLLLAYLAALLALAWPLARWLQAVADGRLPGWMTSLERGLYRLAGVRADEGMSWLRYAVALLVFNGLGALAVYALQRLQAWLPLNPQGMSSVSPDSAFNTAVSFVSNTNWQGYGGESTMSYLTQMLALTVQNFFSGATGIAVAYALIRGFAARSAAMASGCIALSALIKRATTITTFSITTARPPRAKWRSSHRTVSMPISASSITTTEAVAAAPTRWCR